MHLIILTQCRCVINSCYTVSILPLVLHLHQVSPNYSIKVHVAAGFHSNQAETHQT